MSEHRGISLNVQGGGSSSGVQAARSGAAQIGMSSRKLKPAETDLLAVTIAWDAIAVIASPSNPVAALTLAQVKDIFAGRVTRWSQLGGADRPITVIAREEGSGTRGAFDEMVLQKDDITPRALFQDSNGAVREIVAQDRNAIGYMSLGMTDPRVRVLAINGVEPSVATVVNATYKLVRPFLFVLKGAPEGEAKRFIDFILSPRGQAILAREGLIPVTAARGEGGP
jgi:phosphate transport system substrate-binding protein